MNVAVGSNNPAKIRAVERVMNGPVEALDVPSGVSSQPFSDEETQLGAVNRAKACVLAGAQVGIGLEGGVAEMNGELFLCNWGALVTQDGRVFVAGGAKIPLPDKIAKPLRDGQELGPVMAEYTSDKDIRKKAGAIGIFTNGELTRDDMFEHIVKMLYGQYQFS